MHTKPDRKTPLLPEILIIYLTIPILWPNLSQQWNRQQTHKWWSIFGREKKKKKKKNPKSDAKSSSYTLWKRDYTEYSIAYLQCNLLALVLSTILNDFQRHWCMVLFDRAMCVCECLHKIDEGKCSFKP